MAIAVQMLVGRNEEPFLKYAIRSVLPWVDYFTVVNTDPHSAWGKKNAHIIEQEIPDSKLRYNYLAPDPKGYFSFADARNECLELTDPDDFVFIVDSDDVHFPQAEDMIKDAIRSGADSVTAYFYHLMVYKNIFQYVAPREIVYKNVAETYWTKGVHEQLHVSKQHPITSLYHYVHYGYIKPQRDVFRRWKFYSDLEGDFDHYEGQNPNHILDDRVAVCSKLPVEHPAIIREFLDDNYEDCSLTNLRDSPVRRGSFGQDKVGLVLLTSNDGQLIDRCFESLCLTETPPEFDLLAIDCNSTDDSLEKLQQWQLKVPFPMEIVGSDVYTSLAETLNYGFDHFRTDEQYEYVGWIHPDMDFIQKEWLHWLWRELKDNPKIGKICAANFRDMMPDKLIMGHEQCYIMRKDILHKIGLFDEGYIGIGGYEDWDINRRIMTHQGPEGFYEVKITPKSYVLHAGMGTRSKRDTTQEQIANAGYYYKKHGVNTPPC